MIENLQTQQLQLLARKALLLDELKQIEAGLSQIGAILQFDAERQKQASAEPQAE